MSAGRSGLSTMCPVKSTTRASRSCAAGTSPAAASASSMTPSAAVTLSECESKRLEDLDVPARGGNGERIVPDTRERLAILALDTSRLVDRQEQDVGARDRRPVVAVVLLDLEDGIDSQDEVQRRRDPLLARVAVRECIAGLVGIVEGRFPRRRVLLREKALDLEQRQRVGAGIVAAQILGVRIEVGARGHRRDARTKGPRCRGVQRQRRASRPAIASSRCFRAAKKPRRGRRARMRPSSARRMAWSERVRRSCASRRAPSRRASGRSCRGGDSRARRRDSPCAAISNVSLAPGNAFNLNWASPTRRSPSDSHSNPCASCGQQPQVAAVVRRSAPA